MVNNNLTLRRLCSTKGSKFKAQMLRHRWKLLRAKITSKYNIKILKLTIMAGQFNSNIKYNNSTITVLLKIQLGKMIWCTWSKKEFSITSFQSTNTPSPATSLTTSTCSKTPPKNSILAVALFNTVMLHHQWLRLTLIIFLTNSRSRIWIQIFNYSHNKISVFWTLVQRLRLLNRLVILTKIQWECSSPRS